ncbi:MAG: C39 family peptidase, partial [Anaerolineales bacterium]|nr:C39 family peptidase [Anaerolineales bacterium]
MRRGYLFTGILALILLSVLATFVYHLPPVHERLSWRFYNLRVQIYRFFNPPEQVVFIPGEQVEDAILATRLALTPSATFTLSPTITTTLTQTPTHLPPTGTPTRTPTSTPTETPTPSPTAIPAVKTLTGFTHEWQTFNNCGPANLSMALSYWGWSGSQHITKDYLRPDDRDKNTMPREMVAFTENQTELDALWRYGGDLELLKGLVAAGFPVIIEIGYYKPDEYWVGHFVTVSGYDEAAKNFITQDSLLGANKIYSYEHLESRWRDFNFVYVIVYPPERENTLMHVLGPHIDPTYGYQAAAFRALREIETLEGVDRYYAKLNLGTSLVALEDYVAAADAYDDAFAYYPSVPDDKRP